jgi:uncharacterized protein YndB with AHSA1/START domain
MIPENEKKTVLQMKRSFNASREKVFNAWTIPSEIMQWFGPESCHVIDVQVDLRVGGAYRFKISTSTNEETSVHGEFREVSPPAKLIYTWQWENDPDWENLMSIVTVEFIEQNEGTEIRLKQERLPNAESRGNHEHGWAGSFDKLDKYFNE